MNAFVRSPPVRMTALSFQGRASPNGSFSSGLCRVLLSHVFVPGLTYSPPVAIYAGLFTTPPNAEGGGTEVGGDPAYGRPTVSFSPPTPPGALIVNSVVVTWSEATTDWGEIAAIALFDNAINNLGMLCFGLLLAPDGVTPITKEVGEGDVFLCPPGNMAVGLA